MKHPAKQRTKMPFKASQESIRASSHVARKYLLSLVVSLKLILRCLQTSVKSARNHMQSILRPLPAVLRLLWPSTRTVPTQRLPPVTTASPFPILSMLALSATTSAARDTSSRLKNVG